MLLICAMAMSAIEEEDPFFQSLKLGSE